MTTAESDSKRIGPPTVTQGAVFNTTTPTLDTEKHNYINSDNKQAAELTDGGSCDHLLVSQHSYPTALSEGVPLSERIVSFTHMDTNVSRRGVEGSISQIDTNRKHEARAHPTSLTQIIINKSSTKTSQMAKVISTLARRQHLMLALIALTSCFSAIGGHCAPVSDRATSDNFISTQPQQVDEAKPSIINPSQQIQQQQPEAILLELTNRPLNRQRHYQQEGDRVDGDDDNDIILLILSTAAADHSSPQTSSPSISNNNRRLKKRSGTGDQVFAEIQMRRLALKNRERASKLAASNSNDAGQEHSSA